MQRVKPPFFDSRPSLDSHPSLSYPVFDYQSCFTAWDHSEPAHISLKLLQQNLSFLQHQYQSFCKTQLPPKQQLCSPAPLPIPIQKYQLMADSKSNCKLLPKLFSQPKLSLVGAKQQKPNTLLKVKNGNIPKERAESVEEQIKAAQRKRAGSQFRQMRGCFPLETTTVDVFLQKNKKFNISRLLNLNKIRGRASTKLTSYKSNQKQNAPIIARIKYL